MIRSIRCLRSAPVTPAAQASGHSRQNSQNFQNAFGISPRVAAGLQYFFVTGALTLLHEPRSNPPHQRVKPENRFHRHVERRRQVVASAYMAHLVGNDRLQLSRRQPVGDAFRQQQNRTINAEDARLQPH
jgi:hypothetical protein